MNQLEYHAALKDYNKWRLQPDNSLTHWGILGQKWGVRRYQNEDGSLTPEGEIRYRKEMSKIDRKNERESAKSEAIKIKAQQESEINASDNAIKGAKIQAKSEKKSNRILKAAMLVGAGVAVYAIAKKYGNNKVSDFTSSSSNKNSKEKEEAAKKLINSVKETKASDIKGDGIKEGVKALSGSRSKYSVAKAPKLADLTATSKVNISDSAFNKAIVSSSNNRKIRKTIKSDLKSDAKNVAKMLGISEKELLKMNHSEAKSMNIDEYYAALNQNGSHLQHHGILGQKWGIRRYQNEDGSLTPEGRERYTGTKEYGKTVSTIGKMEAEEVRKNRPNFVKKVTLISGAISGIAGGVTGGLIKGGLGGVIGAVGGITLGSLFGAGDAAMYSKIDESIINKSVKKLDKMLETDVTKMPVAEFELKVEKRAKNVLGNSLTSRLNREYGGGAVGASLAAIDYKTGNMNSRTRDIADMTTASNLLYKKRKSDLKSIRKEEHNKNS